MYKRLLMSLVLTVSVPVAAHAWYVTGKMSPAGTGSITPSGMKSISGTTGTSLVATAKPNGGFKISQVLIDNAKQNLPAPDANGNYNFPITYNGVFYRNFTVTYVAALYNITASVDANSTGNGTIAEQGSFSLTNIPAGQSRTMVISADQVSQIESLLVNGVAQATAAGATTFALPLTNINQNYSLVAKFKKIYTTKTAGYCTSCHTSRNPSTDKFYDTKHWNNHLETGPEFTTQLNTVVNGPVVLTDGTSDGVLNANDSYTTKENGAVVTCAYRCHFRPGMGIYSSVPGYLSHNKATATIQGAAGTPPRAGGDGCEACHDASNMSQVRTYQDTCMACHNGGKHGKVPSEFWSSKHWDNNLETGPEFAGQIETILDKSTTVNGGTVTKTGNVLPGVMNANDSYKTSENGGATTCAYRCHFRPGMYPADVTPPANYVDAKGRSTTYVTYTDTTGKYGAAGTVYSRPGGNACMACHDSHGLDATAQSTCYTCHAGGNHGWSVAAFEKSSHFSGDAAKQYYQMDKKSCLACHNAHSTEATFADMSTATILHTAGLATGCQQCHAPGSPYSVYSSNGVGKAGHFQTAAPDASGFYATASYIQPTASVSATCGDCHYHNNTINAGWAEGGHASTTAVPWKSDSSHIWLDQGPAANGVNFQASPQQSNCIRCHSTQGYIQFVDSNFTKIDKIKDANGNSIKDSSPLTCNACHIAKTAGTAKYDGSLRKANFGTTGYKAFWGYSNATYSPKKTVTSIQLGDNRNSNLCMPCHSQRASGQELKDIFAAGGSNVQNIGSAVYPHAAQPAAIFYGKGGYEFTVQNGSSTNGFGYQDRARHQRIGNYGTTGTGYNNTGITQGSCVGCHMTTTGKTHNLEIGAKDANGNLTSITSTECSKCHPTDFTYQNLNGKSAELQALIGALGNLLVKKGITQDGATPLAERKSPFDMSLGTADLVKAEKNAGAWFNWYLFKTSDPGAYAHNPSYARRLLTDSIDWLDDGILNGSAAASIQKMGVSTDPLYSANVDVAKALSYSQDPGCLGCHYGTNTSSTNPPGVQQAPHYNTTGALVPGQTFTQAQFVVPGSQCNECHGYGHGTDSPNYSYDGTGYGVAVKGKASFPVVSSAQGKGLNKNYAESAHGEINGLAWTDYNFLNLSSRATCTPCHTTQGFVAAVANANANGGRISATPFLGNANETSKQVLGCNACHSSTAWKSSVRTIAGGYVAGMGGYPGVASISYPDVGESNVCIPCHASRENGASINASTADFSNTSFKNPHYLAASAVFYGKGGFQFYTSGVRYNTYGAAGKVGRTANWSHGRLGMDNYTAAALNANNAGVVRGTGNKGQCVACHLGPTNAHSYNAFEVAKATWGTSTTQKGCFGCHGTEDMEEVAVGEKANVDRALDLLAYELEGYGLYFNNDKNPYFFTSSAYATSATNWTQNPNSVTVTGKQTMGAAQNLKLLKAEKGSHVHNRSFMRALITDSLVYLQKGQAGIDADRNIRDANINNIINFTNYSTAISAPNSDRLAGKSGSTVGITGLKSYLTRNSGGLYYRR